MTKNNVHRFTIVTVYLLIFLSVFLRTEAQEIKFIEIKSSSDWENVKKMSAESGRKIFLDIYATWCGPCKMMDSKVYNDPAVADYFNAQFINTKTDGESEFGRVLARRFSLKAYPTMYFLGKDDNIFFTVVGFREGPALTGIADQVEKNSERYAELRAKSESGNITEDEKKEYLAFLLQFGQTEMYRKEVEGTLDKLSEPEILDPARKDMIINGGGTVESKAVNTVIKNREHFRNAWGQEEFNKYMSAVFNSSIQSAISTRDEEKLKYIEEILIPVLIADNPGNITRAKLNTRKIYFIQTEQWDRYILAVDEYFAENGSSIPKFLYGEAHYLISNQILNDKLLKQGLEWINRENSNDFSSYFLGAIINTYRKDYSQAEIWFEKAKPLAVTVEEKNSLTELRGYIDKLKVTGQAK